MLSEKTSRYAFIDAIRGIAACLVMIQHALYQSGLLGSNTQEALTGFIPNYLEFGEVGVVSFFLVSGFVIPLSVEKTNNFILFWIHRILRIYPLYLFVYIFTLILMQGGNLSGAYGYILNFLSHLLMIQEYVGQVNFVGGSWTLSIEMVWYIGLSGLFLLSLNRNTLLIVGAGIAISILACVLCAFGLHIPMGRLSMLVCCVLGLICYRYGDGGFSQSVFLTYVVTLLATIGLNLAIGFHFYPSARANASFTMVRDSWALAALVFFVPFMTRRSKVWSHGLLTFLGRISYSIYLAHGMVLIVLAWSGVSGILFVLTTIVSTICLASLTYRFIEAPPIRYGHGLKLMLNKQPAKPKLVR